MFHVCHTGGFFFSDDTFHFTINLHVNFLTVRLRFTLFLTLFDKTVSAVHSHGKMNSSTAQKEEKPSTISCGACKINRKKCSEKCVLAPYFPPDDPQKFLLVHRVFGNRHIIKLLRELQAEQRGDAVSSMVYEATQRFRDPVHGCVGVIDDLLKKVAELQSQLDSRKAEIANISLQHGNLLKLVTNHHEALVPHLYDASEHESEDTHTNPYLSDDILDPMQLWDSPLWG